MSIEKLEADLDEVVNPVEKYVLLLAVVCLMPYNLFMKS